MQQSNKEMENKQTSNKTITNKRDESETIQHVARNDVDNVTYKSCNFIFHKI